MRTTRMIAAAIIALPAALLAADFWTQKKPGDWSEKDCSRLVAKSPWAKDTAVSMGSMGGPMTGGGTGRAQRAGAGGGGGEMGGAGGGMGAGGAGGGGGRGGAGGGGGEMGGPGGQAADIPHVTIRWDSATPVREAMKKVSVTKAVDEADIQAFYIVTVDGLRMMGRQRGGPMDQVTGPRQMPADQQERLKAATELAAKGKDAIQPGKIDVIPGDDGKMTVRFYFPRSNELSLDDKEVTFVTRMGPMEVKQRFVLKDMVFDGKLAL